MVDRVGGELWGGGHKCRGRGGGWGALGPLDHVVQEGDLGQPHILQEVEDVELLRLNIVFNRVAENFILL